MKGIELFQLMRRQEVDWLQGGINVLVITNIKALEPSLCSPCGSSLMVARWLLRLHTSHLHTRAPKHKRRGIFPNISLTRRKHFSDTFHGFPFISHWPDLGHGYPLLGGSLGTGISSTPKGNWRGYF